MKTSSVLGVCLLAPGLAIAQQDMGTITGVVTDPTGGVLPGVTVTARERASDWRPQPSRMSPAFTSSVPCRSARTTSKRSCRAFAGR